LEFAGIEVSEEEGRGIPESALQKLDPHEKPSGTHLNIFQQPSHDSPLCMTAFQSAECGRK